MKAGNAFYRDPTDLPGAVPVFPLSGALLLPGARLPLNIFEPRYLAMVDHALCGDRLIGMVQPRFDRQPEEGAEPLLCEIGCLGRLVSMTETGDGRYLINLQGVCRFRLREEISVETPFRQCQIRPFPEDLQEDRSAGEVDRVKFLRTLRAYLEANELEADWQSFLRAENGVLVNGLAMMAPFGPAEKQALLEAPDLRMRAETLIAITERILAHKEGDAGRTLQ
ncbi:LON peptidase substrate-binding domain-containing protein [Chelativorans sp. J32]|uniref:LON peptidase substrate-binding domain-containing protein n=1 Tax=Chelativorans sp. J32 TaxID=935840 RepID=UPI000480B502|nr:LON peptidase substrate-binding domain-containing protein [Chelativorans sp. J32]